MTHIESVTDKNSRHTATPRGRVTLAHGGGGQLTDELLDELILPRLGNDLLGGLLDSATLAATGTDKLAMTIDSYVVQPWRFPGGDIGRLAVCGTVNDLAVCGGDPVGIALSLILAEGFEMAKLATVIDSIAQAGKEAGVSVVTGDTKVVGRGQADGIYITTAGVARVPRDRAISPQRVTPGDVLIVNGPIGEHGLVVMLAREMPQVQSVLRTDAAPLNGLIQTLLSQVPGVLFMRDATRAGLAGVACDLARDSGLRVTLDEARIPVRPEAQHAADMLGLDPLEVANEGKVVVVVRPYEADAALKAMCSHPLGEGARIIGHIGNVNDGLCELHTLIGGRRIIQKPYGEQLPRIC
jgi:hydrogenase expression/formation protein HypE